MNMTFGGWRPGLREAKTVVSNEFGFGKVYKRKFLLAPTGEADFLPTYASPDVAKSACVFRVLEVEDV